MEDGKNAALHAAVQPELDEMDSMEILKYLDEVQSDRFVKLEETFGSPGWDILAEWAGVKALEFASQAANANKWEDCLRCQGARLAYEDVSTWAASFVQEFKLAAMNAREETEVPDDGFSDE